MFKDVLSGYRLQCWMAEGRRALEDLVFPWECAICEGAASASPFCPACRLELVEASGRSCARCAMPVGPWADVEGGCSECRGRSLGFDGALALGPYQGPIRDLCLRLKHEKDAWLAPWLADLLLEAHASALDPRSPSIAGAWVVPVPLHWRRQWQRGYNQADALARRLARRLSLRMACPLRRARATPHLAGIGRTGRSELMRSAFQVRRRAAGSLSGRTVVLVDDILTTGATCGAAARALKQAGAARVLALVLGRAEGTPGK